MCPCDHDILLTLTLCDLDRDTPVTLTLCDLEPLDVFFGGGGFGGGNQVGVPVICTLGLFGLTYTV